MRRAPLPAPSPLRQGRFELADGGTIFLDEIGDLPPDIQVKFLRVLQEGEFERVGSSRTKTVDVRVIAATHRDLEAAVAAGHVPADLYYRLSVYPIQLPSLRERREDIPQLVWFFINRHQRELGTAHHEGAAGSDGGVAATRLARQRARARERGRAGDDCVHRRHAAARRAAALRRRGRRDLRASDNLDAVQRMHIESVLQSCNWRINGAGNAAERLGIHPNTLRFRMKKLGVAGPAERAPAPGRGADGCVGLTRGGRVDLQADVAGGAHQGRPLATEALQRLDAGEVGRDEIGEVDFEDIASGARREQFSDVRNTQPAGDPDDPPIAFRHHTDPAFHDVLRQSQEMGPRPRQPHKMNLSAESVNLRDPGAGRLR